MSTVKALPLNAEAFESPNDAIALLEELSQGIDKSAQTSPSVTLTPPSPSGENPLYLAEARYRSLVEQIPAVTFMASLEGGVNELYVSPQIEQLLGFTQEEWLEDPVLWHRQLHPEDKDRWNTEFAQMIMAGTVFQSDYRFLSRTGQVVWVRGAAKLVRKEDGSPIFLQGIAFDITHLKEAEAKIRAALKEKELLLKEVHHRVKNNLQITSSLISLQAAEIEDKKTKEVLLESENRVKTMALVHEKLYQSKNLAEIHAAEYLHDLSATLLQSYGVEIERVVLHFDVENISLGIDKAMPLGLILNELISNAIKHAFPHERAGKIWVGLSRDEDHVRLTVADNGVGLPQGFHLSSPQRMGLQLVKDLAYQLNGSADVIQGANTEFRIVFPLPRI